MAFIYCQSCGAKLEYSLKPPNFCSSCGTALGSVDPPSGAVEATPSPPVVKKISKLEYEISSTSSPGLTIGDVVKQESTGTVGRARYKSKTGDPIQDSLSSCKPSRSRDIDEIGG